MVKVYSFYILFFNHNFYSHFASVLYLNEFIASLIVTALIFLSFLFFHLLITRIVFTDFFQKVLEVEWLYNWLTKQGQFKEQKTIDIIETVLGKVGFKITLKPEVAYFISSCVFQLSTFWGIKWCQMALYTKEHLFEKKFGSD